MGSQSHGFRSVFQVVERLAPWVVLPVAALGLTGLDQAQGPPARASRLGWPGQSHPRSRQVGIVTMLIWDLQCCAHLSHCNLGGTHCNATMSYNVMALQRQKQVRM